MTFGYHGMKCFSSPFKALILLGGAIFIGRKAVFGLNSRAVEGEGGPEWAVEVERFRLGTPFSKWCCPNERLIRTQALPPIAGCPNSRLIRTENSPPITGLSEFIVGSDTKPGLIRLLSELPPHSDRKLSAHQETVRIDRRFGHQTWPWSSFCPNSRLIRTEIPPHSDSPPPSIPIHPQPLSKDCSSPCNSRPFYQDKPRVFIRPS